MSEIQNLDKNMAPKTLNENSEIEWYDPGKTPFRLSGFYWYDNDKIFRRLPLSSVDTIEKVNPSVNALASNTAGGQIAFSTNSTSLIIKVELSSPSSMNHMPSTGESGFDCYISINGDRFYFEGVSIFDIKQSSYEAVLFTDYPADKKEIQLNFPLYNGVKSISVGLDKNANILPPLDYSIKQPIVIYGTSITQGGCASRPGMSYPAIIARRLNANVINLGFSGNAMGEIEIADIINQIENPSAIIIDIEANASGSDALKNNLLPFINRLRAVNPLSPILVISQTPMRPQVHSQKYSEKRIALRAFQKDIVDQLKSQGDTNIYFLDGRELFDEYYDEYSVDTVHPTDLGFMQIATKLIPIISDITKTN